MDWCENHEPGNKTCDHAPRTVPSGRPGRGRVFSTGVAVAVGQLSRAAYGRHILLVPSTNPLNLIWHICANIPCHCSHSGVHRGSKATLLTLRTTNARPGGGVGAYDGLTDGREMGDAAHQRHGVRRALLQDAKHLAPGCALQIPPGI